MSLISPQNWGECSFKPQQTAIMGGAHSISALAALGSAEQPVRLLHSELGSEQMSRRQPPTRILLYQKDPHCTRKGAGSPCVA